MQICDITLDQWINIVLTVVIVIAVSAQAWFTRAQARLLKDSEQRARDRDKPRLRIVPSSHGVSRIDLSGENTRTSFEGFTVTNAGFADIEITFFTFEVGKLPSTEEDEYPTDQVQFPPVAQHDETILSTMSLPHRLRPGESFRVVFDAEQLVSESAKIGGGTPVHMRPCFHDSLGNKHMPDHWIIYKEVDAVAFAHGPSPGRISEEDWSRLKPKERDRYSRGSRLSVPPRSIWS